jgi:hypothetical protein
VRDGQPVGRRLRGDFEGVGAQCRLAALRLVQEQRAGDHSRRDGWADDVVPKLHNDLLFLA